MVKKMLFLIFLMGTLLTAKAQVSCFAQIQLDRNSVYAQQPFKVTITVLTATWYTAPLDFENLQIPNAFIIPFDRTMPGMFTINGKQYAGLQFYYIVFPYKPGRFMLPAISIVATTPPLNESVAKKVTVKTSPVPYIVKPVPQNFSGDNWFVAKDVAISKKWNKPLNKLKVGDVINSTITINARGTLPQFIPELKADSLDWAGVYPGSVSLADTRDDYDANGTRTQTATYLLEKEGNFVLPASSIEWFNPVNGKIYKRNTPAVRIHVGPNPNLGILKTLKDSLATKQPVQPTIAVKHGPWLVYGIPWYYFALYTLAGICVLYFIIKMIIKLVKWLMKKRQIYLSGENYWFGKFNRSSTSFPVLLKNMYFWWDRFPVTNKSASIQNDAKSKGDELINEKLASYYKQEYSGDSSSVNVESTFKKHVKQYRAELKCNAGANTNDKISINQTGLD
ncbi:BatD family protein [Mucilaginibacter agri]|uniref:Oxygen tolerance n=1 Tax=Mucilaginibacter agri TaxID=2695265 RepID=A0A965ZKD3_9SPHI|nr:BatD family protein [Mucilaginibacter agri]NCD71241.1 hypothetical protein [Mucilaginibacter agri]